MGRMPNQDTGASIFNVQLLVPRRLLQFSSTFTRLHQNMQQAEQKISRKEVYHQELAAQGIVADQLISKRLMWLNLWSCLGALNYGFR